MTTTRLALEKLVAGVTTRADLISYWNSNADILDTLIKGTGISGGQTINGGTGSGENLKLVSTAHATKGAIGVESEKICFRLDSYPLHDFIKYGDVFGSDDVLSWCMHDFAGGVKIGTYNHLTETYTARARFYHGMLKLGGGSVPTVGLELPNSATTGEGLAYAWGTHSSLRWKTNITPIQSALDKIAQLQGVEFDWKPENGGEHDIGLIAEDVGKIIPEVVTYEENGVDAKCVRYDRLVALLIAGMQEQQKEIENMRIEIDVLAGGR